MALIKCPECGHSISEYADKCISCGCPMSKIKELIILKKSTKPEETNKSDHQEENLYNTLKPEEKVLVDDIESFINKKSNLVLVSYSKSFGFKHADDKVMSIVFERIKKELFVIFRFSIRYAQDKIKVSSENLVFIKQRILDIYSKETIPLQPNINNPLPKDTEKETPVLFTKTRNEYDNSLIKIFEEKIRSYFKDIIVKEYQYMYSFKLSVNNNLHLICWFANGDNDKLAFKCYMKPLEKESQIVRYPVTNKDIEYLARITCRVQLSYVAKTISPIASTPLIYKAIVAAINGKTITVNSNINTISKEVAEFVITEVKNNAIEQKFFKNEAEFNAFKNSYRFEPNFFGHIFSFKYLTEEDAKIFYMFYKAAKLVDIIKKYENIYNVKIIEDYVTLLKSLKRIIEKEENNYKNAEGLTSNIRFIPEEVLEKRLYELSVLETF